MNSTRRFRFWLAGLALVGVPAAHAQGLFRVTGVAPPGSATFESAAGERGTLGATLLPGKVQVADGAALMLFEPKSGAAAVVLGPASFVAQSDETTGGVRLELQSGKLMFAYAPGAGEAQPPVVATVPSASAQIGVELLAALGRTYVYRAGDRVEVGYVSSGAQAALALSVNRAAVSLPSDHVLLIDWRGDHKIDPLGDWLARTGFDQIDQLAGKIGSASAQEARVGVADRLFSNIIVWDLYAKAEHVVAPPTPGFETEIRQAAVAATAIGRSTTRGGIQKTQPVPAANAVPLLSPAAASVQNVGAGVTAIELNRRAAELLVATGSRGLGFRGPAQLAIPGFFGSGLRSVGPAGLGAH